MQNKMILALWAWSITVSFFAWSWVEQDYQSKRINWEEYQYKLGLQECEKRSIAGGLKNETRK